MFIQIMSGRGRKQAVVFSSSDKRQIYKMKRSGEYVSEIARQFGTYPARIKKVIEEMQNLEFGDDDNIVTNYVKPAKKVVFGDLVSRKNESSSESDDSSDSGTESSGEEKSESEESSSESVSEEIEERSESEEEVEEVPASSSKQIRDLKPKKPKKPRKVKVIYVEKQPETVTSTVSANNPDKFLRVVRPAGEQQPVPNFMQPKLQTQNSASTQSCEKSDSEDDLPEIVTPAISRKKLPTSSDPTEID